MQPDIKRESLESFHAYQYGRKLRWGRGLEKSQTSVAAYNREKQGMTVIHFFPSGKMKREKDSNIPQRD